MKVQHIAIKASELRNGDLMRVGSSTNYVLVHSVSKVDDLLAVTLYNGDVANENGPTLFLDPDRTVDLSPHGTNDRGTADGAQSGHLHPDGVRCWTHSNCEAREALAKLREFAASKNDPALSALVAQVGASLPESVVN